MSHILLIEADPQLCQLLCPHLVHEGHAVHAVADGASGVAWAQKEQPDVVLLDLSLPGMHGFSCCQALRAVSDVPLLVFAERPDGMDGIAGLDLGADDYVVKPIRLSELLARVRALIRRSATRLHGVPQEALMVNDMRVDLAEHRVFLRNAEVKLAHKEFDLLCMLMRYRGIALPRELLLEQVWGHDDRQGIRTVDVHIRWLREKIETDPAQPQYIQTVRGIGYRFETVAPVVV